MAEEATQETMRMIKIYLGQCVPKCWHAKLRGLGITQKKEYSIHNMAKV